MEVVHIFMLAGTLILGILIGIIIGIIRFGESPPVGALKIHHSEPEEEPYMFLELWKGTGDVTRMDTVRLVVSVEDTPTPK